MSVSLSGYISEWSVTVNFDGLKEFQILVMILKKGKLNTFLFFTLEMKNFVFRVENQNGAEAFEWLCFDGNRKRFNLKDSNSILIFGILS